MVAASGIWRFPFAGGARLALLAAADGFAAPAIEVARAASDLLLIAALTTRRPRWWWPVWPPTARCVPVRWSKSNTRRGHTALGCAGTGHSAAGARPLALHPRDDLRRHA
nr:hypothetical protein [Verrucosispora sioxanthis]